MTPKSHDRFRDWLDKEIDCSEGIVKDQVKAQGGKASDYQLGYYDALNSVRCYFTGDL